MYAGIEFVAKETHILSIYEGTVLCMHFNSTPETHTVGGQKYSSRLENSIDLHVFSRLLLLVIVFQYFLCHLEHPVYR